MVHALCAETWAILRWQCAQRRRRAHAEEWCSLCGRRRIILLGRRPAATTWREETRYIIVRIINLEDLKQIVLVTRPEIEVSD